MTSSTIDLRFWLLNTLVDIAHPRALSILCGCFFFLIFLFFSLSPILLAKLRKNNLKDRVLSEPVFFLSCAFFLLSIRWPSLISPLINPDEAQWISAAITLLKDPVFWRSVDCLTSGPLNIYPLVLPALFGFKIEYASVRLIGIALVILSLFLLYVSLRHLYGRPLARLACLPIVVYQSTLFYKDFKFFSSEYVSAALLSGALLLLVKYYCQGTKSRNVQLFFFGFVLGLTPYAKFQSIPIAFSLFCIGVHVLWTKSVTKDFFLKRVLLVIYGGVFFSILMAVYLSIFSLWDVFWSSYIRQNIFYAHLTLPFLKKISMWMAFVPSDGSPCLLFGVKGLIVAFGLLILIIMRIWRFQFFFRGKSKTFVFISYGLIFFATSLYAVVQSGSDFPHYLLLTLIPSGLLLGVCVGEWGVLFRNRFSVRARRMFSGVAAVFIVAACSLKLYDCLRLWRFVPHNHDEIALRYISTEAKLIRTLASDGDSMAVWGWAPELYVETQLVQATREGVTYAQRTRSPLLPYFINRFVSDLKRYKPRIFVITLSIVEYRFGQFRYGYKLYPEVARIVQEEYYLAAIKGNLRIYVRK